MSFIRSVARDTGQWVRKRPALSRWLLRCLPDCHVQVTVPTVGLMRVRLRRNRSYWLRAPLELERYPMALLRAMVKPEHTVWDVGANLGLYARWLVAVPGARRVVSFEPMSANLPDLRYNLALGGVTDRVTVVPCALADTEGEVEFQVDDMQSASGTVNAVTGGKPCAARAAVGLPPLTEKVLCRTVDGILRTGELPRPDVMKIDVEGAEHLLLRGGDHFFREGHPRLMIETHGLDVARRCLEFLFDRGYHVAACVNPDWVPGRFMHLKRDVLGRMVGMYDVTFLAASKDVSELPQQQPW